jgi:hypothetical protein
MLWLAPAAGHAEQFVLFDVTYTYTQADAVNAKPSKSHFYVRSQMNPMRPKDWTAPIDYRNGTVHVRTEVIDKPTGGVATAWTLCYIPYKGIGSGYGCTNTSVFTEEGLFDRDVTMTSWWQNEDIVWSQGIMGMDLVLKDDKGVFSHMRPDPEHFFPTTVRITMIQVSAGATYDASKVPNIPPAGADGGAPDVSGPQPDAAVSMDVAMPGTGGAGTGGSGSGGASGTGGASPGSGGAPGTGGAPAHPGETTAGGCSITNRSDQTGGAAFLIAALGFCATIAYRRRRR